jgi:hypothetical protein
MKTKTIIFGVVIAVISTLTISKGNAQAQEPAVKIVSTIQPDVIKVIYGYDSRESVEVKFTNAEGLLTTDKISGKDFKGGFLKKYNVQAMSGNAFWIDVTSPELSVTFKMTTGKNGKWSAQLEKTTYFNPIVALK